MSRAQRFVTLDAMRGIGALAVAVYHLHETLEAPSRWAASGYLAVDFFFLLSGFVVARAYEAPLLGAMSFTEFVRVRLVRLYPLFAIGLALGVVRAIGQLAMNRPDRLGALGIAAATLSNALLMPSVVTAHISPLNGPGWSLILEFAINLAYGALLVHFGNRALMAVVAISGVLLVAASVAAGSVNIGVIAQNLPGGLARVTFSFTLGVLLSRLHRRAAAPSAWFLAPLAVLTLALCIDPAPQWRLAFDLLFAAVGAPCLVWWGASMNPPQMLRRAAAWLGDLSYPLYAVHYPLMWMIGFALRKAGVPDAIWMPVFIVSCAFLAVALAHRVDAPIRRWLSRQ